MQPRRATRSRRHRWLAAVAIAGLVAASCGGDDDDDAGDDSAAVTADDGADDTAEAGDDTGDTGDDSGETDAGDDGDDGDDDADGGGDDDAPESTSNLEQDPDEVASSGEGADDADLEPQAGGTLRVGLAADGTGFNTIAAIAPGSSRVINSLNDSLMAIDEEGNTAPNLAESMIPNDDFTSWTITLRPGVTFHDGAAVDAAAVKANLDAFRSSPSVGYGMATVTEITAVDDLTVQVDLSAPWVAFDNYVVGQPGYMVSPDTIGTNDTFVGTGPFVLESWTPGDSARVVRNDDYWRDGMPYLDAIEFKYIPDQSVRRQALESGDVDLIVSPSDADIVDFLDTDDVNVFIGGGSANESLFILNTAQPPFDDLRVRQAMAYALDRQLFVDVLRSGLTTPADGPIGESSKWYTETDYPDYDPAMAAQLVDEYEAENGPVQFVVKGEPTPESQEQRDLAISFWEDAGMEVTSEDIGLGQSVGTVIADDFQAIAWVQFSAIDPDGDRSFFRSGGPLNWSNFEDPRIDEALDAGRNNGDFQTRYDAYAQFQQVLAEQLPMVWVDHLAGVESVAAAPTVHNVARRELPDGTPGLAFLAGSFFSYENVWIDQ